MASRSNSPGTTTAPTARGSASSRAPTRGPPFATPAAERRGDEFGRQLHDDRRGDGPELRARLGSADGDAVHARGHRGANTGHRIFEDENIAGRAVQYPCRGEKAFRVRFTLADVFFGDHEADQLTRGA